MLSDDERAALIAALWRWAEDAPDAPVVGFWGGGGLLTPRQLAEAAEERDRNGAALLEVLEHGVRREGLDEVTRRISRGPTVAARLFVALRSIGERLGGRLQFVPESRLDPGAVLRPAGGRLEFVGRLAELGDGDLPFEVEAPADVLDLQGAVVTTTRALEPGETGTIEIEFGAAGDWLLALRDHRRATLDGDALAQLLDDPAIAEQLPPDALVVRSVGEAENAFVAAAHRRGAGLRLELAPSLDPEASPAKALASDRTSLVHHHDVSVARRPFAIYSFVRVDRRRGPAEGFDELSGLFAADAELFERGG